MPSKESGFRNDATPEDDLNDSLRCQRGNEAFLHRNHSRRILVANW